MRWERIGKDYVSGPWLIRRYGLVFLLLRNSKEVSKHSKVTAAKLAAEAYLNTRE